MPAFLIDLDGVIFQDGHPIPGAIETIAWLQEERIPFLFVTNSSFAPRQALVDKLSGFGIKVTQKLLLTPLIAANHWLAKNASGPAALFMSQEARRDINNVKILDHNAVSGAASVVIGELEWTFAEMNRAFQLLMADPKPVLVALGMARYWRGSDGLTLDVGPFVKALEYAAGCQAVVLGKPAAAFFETALQTLECQPSKTFMIGDDIVGDIQGAQQAGLRGLLVRTGKFRPVDLEFGIQPSAVLDSIAELPTWWRSTQ